METKTIKRFSIGMMLITFTLMICAAFGVPQSVFAAQSYSDHVGETIRLTQPASNYSVVAGQVELPTADFNGTLKVVAVTNNSAKQVIEVEPGTTSSPYTPTLDLVEEVSSYTVTYTLTAANNVETKTVINVDIDLTQPVFEWKANTKNIIPTKVNKKTDGSFTQINLPQPTIKDVDGNELTDGTLTVDAYDPDQTKITSQIDNFVWTAVEGNKVGTYTFVYTYKSSTSYTKTQTFTFTLTEETIETVLQISDWKDSKSLPTSMALFVESELPQPVVVNTKASNAKVDVYTNIYLKCVPDDETIQGTTYTNDESKKTTAGYTYTAELDDFKFTPTVAGKYTVTYRVEDFFGNTAEQSSDANAISVSKTKASGQGFVVPKYAEADIDDMIADMDAGTLLTAEDQIPSYVYKGYKFDFPALFGYDKAYGEESLENLTYQITISYTEPGKSSATRLSYSSAINETATNNRHLDPTDPTKNADLKDFEFKFAVDYTIRYLISDQQNNSLFDNTYTVKVAETKPDTEVSINMSGLNTIVKYGETLKFSVTASSFLSSDKSVTADERPTVVVKYTVGTSTVETVIQIHNDGFYYLDLVGDDFSGNQELKIIAKATDDLDVSKEIPKTIQIQDIQSDVSAPVVAYGDEIKFVGNEWGDGTTMNTIYAGTVLKLPIIVFDDESSFQVSAKILCNDKILSTGVWGARGENQPVSIGGQTFTASKVGTYTVVYEAKDLAGNIATKSFTFDVVGEEIPILHVGSFASSYEYGDEIDISNISVTINGEEVDSEYYTNIITNIPTSQEKVVDLINAFLATPAEIYTDPDTGISYYPADYKIKGSILCMIEGNVAVVDAQDLKTIIRAGQEGSITLTYWAVSENGDFNESPTSVTFDVADTKGPIVTLNAEKITTSAYDEEETIKIYIPDATSKDYISNEHCDVAITAKYKSDTTNLEIVKDDTNAGYYGYVVATKVGIIEVTYSSKDNMGNEAQYLTADETESLTYTISVGDVSAPVINTTELQEYVDSKNYKYQNEVTLDLSKLSITKDLSYESDGFSYKVTCDGVTVEDVTLDGSMLSFTASSYGDYVVSFDVEDASGIAADTKTVSFTISKEGGESTTSTTIWGTVLIIAVLVVLGVVIFLFAKPTKSKAKVKTESKKDDSKDKKNDKIEV